MSYQIDPTRVQGVIVECNNALMGKPFNHGEVIVGVSELLGRVIVEAGKHHIHHEELKKVAFGHIENTVRIGGYATNKSIIAKD